VLRDPYGRRGAFSKTGQNTVKIATIYNQISQQGNVRRGPCMTRLSEHRLLRSHRHQRRAKDKPAEHEAKLRARTMDDALRRGCRGRGSRGRGGRRGRDGARGARCGCCAHARARRKQKARALARRARDAPEAATLAALADAALATLDAALAALAAALLAAPTADDATLAALDAALAALPESVALRLAVREVVSGADAGALEAAEPQSAAKSCVAAVRSEVEQFAVMQPVALVRNAGVLQTQDVFVLRGGRQVVRAAGGRDGCEAHRLPQPASETAWSAQVWTQAESVWPRESEARARRAVAWTKSMVDGYE
jgi:hypothetical protein